MDRIRSIIDDTRFRIGVIFAAGIILVFFLAIFIRSLSSPTPSADPDQPSQNQQEIQSRTYPQVTFSDYEVQTELPEPDPNSNMFVFRTEFDQTYIENVAAGLGFETQEVDNVNPYIVVRDPVSQKVLNFDSHTGTFYFFSGNPVEVITDSSNPLRVVEDYLSDAGLQDGYIGCTHWYKEKELPETIFVECHRLWSSVGYPILNAYGAMNLPADVSLADLRLGQVFPSGPEDANIAATSDNKPGKARPNNFNTMTIALVDNNVRAVTSTMRPLADVQPISSDTILTPEAAEAELTSNPNRFKLIWPAGEGVVDVDKIYNAENVRADSVVVTDSILAYVEEDPRQKQSQLNLSYVFKGTAVLENGMDVAFLDVIPAVQGEEQILGISSDEYIAQNSYCDDGKTIQFCTIPFLGSPTPSPTPNPTQTPTPTPTDVPFIPITVTPTPSPSPTPPPTRTPQPTPIPDKECPDYNRELVLPNGSKVIYTHGDGSTESHSDGFYFVPPEGFNISVGQEVVVPEEYSYCIEFWSERFGGRGESVPDDREALFIEKVQTCVVRNILSDQNIRWGKDIRSLCKPDTASPCAVSSQSAEVPSQCYPFTPASPYLFVYNPQGSSVHVGLDAPAEITYAFPADQQGSWTVSEPYKRIYYEYNNRLLGDYIDKKVFNQGYSIKTADLEELVYDLSEMLNLTPEERTLFVKEALRETRTISSEFIKVTVVDKNVVNTILPLNISRAATVERVHLAVQPAYQSTYLEKPDLKPIQRSGLTVVELGVSAWE